MPKYLLLVEISTDAPATAFVNDDEIIDAVAATSRVTAAHIADIWERSEDSHTAMVAEVKAALEGDSNDEEHDALVYVADVFNIGYTSPEEREDEEENEEERLEALQVEQEAADGGYSER